MSSFDRVKHWFDENTQSLRALGENKYVGMLYDRFAGLPPATQKRVTIAGFTLGLLLVISFLWSTISVVWNYTKRSQEGLEMVTMLTQHTQTMQKLGADSSSGDRNVPLLGPNAMKKFVTDQARGTRVSTRLIKVTESVDSPAAGESQTIKVKRATVTMERVNLEQLVGMLKTIEYGNYDLGVTLLKITNDDKLRGYMNVEMGIVAYILGSGEPDAVQE